MNINWFSKWLCHQESTTKEQNHPIVNSIRSLSRILTTTTLIPNSPTIDEMEYWALLTFVMATEIKCQLLTEIFHTGLPLQTYNPSISPSNLINVVFLAEKHKITKTCFKISGILIIQTHVIVKQRYFYFQKSLTLGKSTRRMFNLITYIHI